MLPSGDDELLDVGLAVFPRSDSHDCSTALNTNPVAGTVADAAAVDAGGATVCEFDCAGLVSTRVSQHPPCSTVVHSADATVNLAHALSPSVPQTVKSRSGAALIFTSIPVAHAVPDGIDEAADPATDSGTTASGFRLVEAWNARGLEFSTDPCLGVVPSFGTGDGVACGAVRGISPSSGVSIDVVALSVADEVPPSAA